MGVCGVKPKHCPHSRVVVRQGVELGMRLHAPMGIHMSLVFVRLLSIPASIMSLSCPVCPICHLLSSAIHSCPSLRPRPCASLRARAGTRRLEQRPDAKRGKEGKDDAHTAPGGEEAIDSHVGHEKRGGREEAEPVAVCGDDFVHVLCGNEGIERNREQGVVVGIRRIPRSSSHILSCPVMNLVKERM